jgi:hypothetical protein
MALLHAKFHENPSTHSRVIKCVPTDVTCEDVRIGKVWLGCGAHAQRITGNGVIIIPPHDFKQPPSWYHRVLKFKKCEFGIFSMA